MYWRRESLCVSGGFLDERCLCELVLLSKGYAVCLLRGRVCNLGFSTKQYKKAVCGNHVCALVLSFGVFFRVLSFTQQPLVVQGILFIEASRSHSDTPHLVGLLWTGDEPDAETSTWRHPTVTTGKLPCRRRDSNPQSQQASGHRCCLV
jgi:hypothetical protein